MIPQTTVGGSKHTPSHVELSSHIQITTYTDNYVLARSTQQFFHGEDVESVNETLLRNGFIGATPERPSIAFSITLFEIFRQIHRVCPRLSIYGISKALSYIHGVRFFVLHLELF